MKVVSRACRSFTLSEYSKSIGLSPPSPLPPIMTPCLQGYTTVHHDRLAGNVTARRRCQKDSHALEIVQVAQTAQGGSRLEAFPVGIDGGRGHARGEPTRRDGIDQDTVPPPLHRQRPGESDHTGLAGVIGDRLRRFWIAGAQPGDRGNIDYPATL